MLLHLVPVSAFCSAGACRKRGLCAAAAGDRGEENGDIVRPEAGGGRNAGLAAGAGGYRLLGAKWGVQHLILSPKSPPGGGGNPGGAPYWGATSCPSGPLPAGTAESQRWGLFWLGKLCSLQWGTSRCEWDTGQPPPSPSPALHPLTDSRAPPRARSCTDRHHHQGLL